MSNSPKTSKHWGMNEAQYYATLYNQPVVIAFIGHKQGIVGKLIGIDKYNLFVERRVNHLTVLIPKHAVRYLSPVPREEESKP